METADIIIVFRQSAIEQLSSADDLHAASAGTNERQEGMGNLGSSLTDGFCLLETSEVVHLEQHQSVVGSHDALLVPVLHQRREAYLGDVLRVEMQQAVHGVVHLAHLHQRIDVAQLFALLVVRLFLNHLYHLWHLHLPECHRVAIVLDNSNLRHFRCKHYKRLQRYK